MTQQQIGLSLELINGHGMSYEDVSYLCSCLPSTLRRLDRQYMCYKFEGHSITIQSKLNDITEPNDIIGIQ